MKSRKIGGKTPQTKLTKLIIKEITSTWGKQGKLFLKPKMNTSRYTGLTVTAFSSGHS